MLLQCLNNFAESLSARRAWIEIESVFVFGLNIQNVALRKESVDRNLDDVDGGDLVHVALRKESVDRNIIFNACCAKPIRRSPQGERG